MNIISQREILRQIHEEKRRQKEDAERDAYSLRMEIARQVPVYADMEGAIAHILMDAAQKSLRDPGRSAEFSAQAQQQVRHLREESESALRAAGYTPEMLTPKYHCSLCRDTGWVGEDESIRNRCKCVETELMRRLYDAADIGDECFAKFDLNIFSDEPTETGRSQRRVMEQYRNYCKRYADSFPDTEKRNLVLLGPSGLGKTFMLNCIAARLLERNVPVLRITAYKMLDAMRRYHRGENDNGFDLMIHADLLIIDDLGTEPMLENITVEYLFTLLNERRTNRLPTLIASNLSLLELQKRYTERVFSRIFDTSETAMLNFIGNDVRLSRR